MTCVSKSSPGSGPGQRQMLRVEFIVVVDSDLICENLLVLGYRGSWFEEMVII